MHGGVTVVRAAAFKIPSSGRFPHEARSPAADALAAAATPSPAWCSGTVNPLDLDRGIKRFARAFLAAIPLGRPQTAEDIGHACADLAANITGEALKVSGGQQMH